MRIAANQQLHLGYRFLVQKYFKAHHILPTAEPQFHSSGTPSSKTGHNAGNLRLMSTSKSYSPFTHDQLKWTNHPPHAPPKPPKWDVKKGTKISFVSCLPCLTVLPRSRPTSFLCFLNGLNSWRWDCSSPVWLIESVFVFCNDSALFAHSSLRIALYEQSYHCRDISDTRSSTLRPLTQKNNTQTRDAWCSI